MGTNKITKNKIALIIHNKVFRHAIKFYLQNYLSCEIIYEKSDIKSANNNSFIQQADILIIDIGISVLNSFETVNQSFFKLFKDKIIVLINNDDKIYKQKIINTGIKSIVYKINIYKELKNAIFKIIERELPIQHKLES